jgi:hypothetical protein
LRRQPIESCKGALVKLLRRAHSGIVFNKHYKVDGEYVSHAMPFRLRRNRVEAAWLSGTVWVDLNIG